MGKKRLSKTEPTIEKVRSQFNNWRKNKEHKRVPIPSKLWDEAIKLTDDYSVNYIAKALKLNYMAFRERVVIAKNLKHRKNSSSCNFVEFEVPNHISPGKERSYEIEVADSRGRKLRLRGEGLAEMMTAIMSIWKKCV